MKIVIFGATGFIGNSVFHSLVAEHDVTIASRSPINGYPKWKYVDFQKENNWSDLLEETDLVINCIGIIEGDFDVVQTKAPIELYKRCVSRGISVIHISAIGAEKQEPVSAFLQSKKITDDFLLTYDKAKVIYPGIVIGDGGQSAQFFAEIAAFPIIPLLKDTIPFVHIDQLTQLIVDVVNDFDTFPKRIFAFGKPESLKTILESIKGRKITTVTIPNIIFKLLFKIFPEMSIGVFNKATFELSRQNLTDNHQPIFGEVSQFIKPNSIRKGKTTIVLFALLSLSFVWIWSGVSSLVSFEVSMDLMREIGANRQFSISAIFAGSFVDILLGITMLNRKYRRWSIIAQFLVMGIYMVLLSVFAPYYWLHPFGVLSKNIPMVVLGVFLIGKQRDGVFYETRRC